MGFLGAEREQAEEGVLSMLSVFSCAVSEFEMVQKQAVS
jgi:hypothetical protein